jgi:hypothetical protein
LGEERQGGAHSQGAQTSQKEARTSGRKGVLRNLEWFGQEKLGRIRTSGRARVMEASTSEVRRAWIKKYVQMEEVHIDKEGAYG